MEYLGFSQNNTIGVELHLYIYRKLKSVLLKLCSSIFREGKQIQEPSFSHFLSVIQMLSPRSKCMSTCRNTHINTYFLSVTGRDQSWCRSANWGWGRAQEKVALCNHDVLGWASKLELPWARWEGLVKLQSVFLEKLRPYNCQQLRIVTHRPPLLYMHVHLGALQETEKKQQQPPPSKHRITSQDGTVLIQRIP